MGSVSNNSSGTSRTAQMVLKRLATVFGLAVFAIEFFDSIFLPGLVVILMALTLSRPIKPVCQRGYDSFRSV